MNFRIFAFLAVMGLVLTGCQTLQGIQRDFGTLANSIGNKTAPKEAQNAKTAILQDGVCPSIFVDPQLDRMVEFFDMEKPDPAQEVSRIALTRTQNECVVEGEFLTMRIDLSFSGALGPKARRKENDRPFFAYPYFVAVTDGQGTELAREIFAASVTYDKKQNNIDLVETIRQKLPLNDDESVPAYEVHIGFQLTEEQLFYNASL